MDIHFLLSVYINRVGGWRNECTGKLSLRHWMDIRNLFSAKLCCPEGKPKGIFKCTFGMTEHAGWFIPDFIAALFKAGVGVYATYHKGHGENVKEEENYASIFKTKSRLECRLCLMLFLYSEIVKKRGRHARYFLLGIYGFFLSKTCCAVQL